MIAIILKTENKRLESQGYEGTLVYVKLPGPVVALLATALKMLSGGPPALPELISWAFEARWTRNLCLCW